MGTVILICLYTAACVKWGDLRRWREFYPTILFVIVGDLVYNLLFYNYTLWRYDSLINHTLTDILVCVTIFPCSVIMFLTHYPERRAIKPLYVLAWAGAHTLIEYVSVLLGGISYDNGWSIFYSFGLYLGSYLFIRFHFKHPLAVWPAAMLTAGFVMLLFKLPMHLIK